MLCAYISSQWPFQNIALQIFLVDTVKLTSYKKLVGLTEGVAHGPKEELQSSADIRLILETRVKAEGIGRADKISHKTTS